MSHRIAKKAAMIIGGTAVGAGVVVLGVPAAVAALGFGSSGIIAGSTAAWMMSLSGGATQAGSVVAVCQSIGATGAVSASTGVIGSAIGGVIGFFAGKSNEEDGEDGESEENEE